MLSTALLNALAFLPQGPQDGSTAPVVINEFSFDDSSGDDLEFIEIYNRSSLPIDLENWSLVGDDSNGVNFTETFPAGTILNPGDFLVVGDTNVPNVDIIRASGFLQNSNESISIFDDNGTVVDTLIYEANKGLFNPALAEGEGIWANGFLNEGSPTTHQRLRDGWDTDNNGDDFRLLPWSPGASNTQPRVPSVFEAFDALTVGSAVGGWGSSFVTPTVIDPATIDPANPSVIPPSPQGGNAAVCWDPAGGGDHCMLLSDATRNARFECYVYLGTDPLNVDELEMWSMGFGTSGPFYNFPDPTGALGFTANGDTGVVWTYVHDEFGANLYLMDRNDGGQGGTALTPDVVIGTIPITTGSNDGWQRLLIEIDNGNVTARFGGTYGAADGTVFTFTTDLVDRGLFVSYREGMTTGVIGARPFTMDLLSVEVQNSATARAYGAGCDGLALVANGVPALGNLGFALNVENITAGPIAFVGFGTAVVDPGLPLAAFGMAGCNGHTNLNIGLFGTGAVAAGSASLPLPIPNTPSTINTLISAQGIAFTPATMLGLGTTNGLELILGL